MPDAGGPDERRTTYDAMIDTLAALHSVDFEKAGLSDYGKPGNYFGRQVDRWTKQYRLSETETMPETGKADRIPAGNLAGTDSDKHRPRRLSHRQHDLCSERTEGHRCT